MKARIPPKHRLTKEILDVAVREAKRQADEQIDDVCKRCTNEFYVAMHQAGLSPKTIKKVSIVLKEVVIPHCDELREQSVKDRAKLHVSYIHDGDDFLEMYCTEHGLPYEQTDRKEDLNGCCKSSCTLQPPRSKGMYCADGRKVWH